jgi:hypothetical protein
MSADSRGSAGGHARVVLSCRDDWCIRQRGGGFSGEPRRTGLCLPDPSRCDTRLLFASCASRHNSCIAQGALLRGEQLTRTPRSSQSTAVEQPHCRKARLPRSGNSQRRLRSGGSMSCTTTAATPSLSCAWHATPAALPYPTSAAHEF